VVAALGRRFVRDAHTPGEYDLRCRATDATGAVQPVEQHWTARGIGNTMAQRVRGHVV